MGGLWGGVVVGWGRVGCDVFSTGATLLEVFGLCRRGRAYPQAKQAAALLKAAAKASSLESSGMCFSVSGF